MGNTSEYLSQQIAALIFVITNTTSVLFLWLLLTQIMNFFMYILEPMEGCLIEGVIEQTTFFKKLVNSKLDLPQHTETKENLPFIFWAFTLLPSFLKPYSHRNLTHDERIFNYRCSRARRVVENAFGILASRFRIFHTEINMNVEKFDFIIMASCILHNFLRRTNRITYTPIGSLDTENIESRKVVPGEWRQKSLSFESASTTLQFF